MPSIRISEFDTWRPGYGQATVRVLKAGTNILASIYTDESLTASASNPQTLNERIIDGVSYGRFAQSFYVGVAYQLEINSVDRTGSLRPPLSSLDDEDASNAVVTVDEGSEAITLADHLARRIDVRDFGAFLAVGEVGASASTNTATLEAAIGVAGAAGGGYVEIPASTYTFNSVTIPAGVVLRGQGRVATTLQSLTAGQVTIIGGARAGFSRLTLDGSTQVANSIGVYSANKDEIVFDDVEVKRFETLIDRRGGKRSRWRELYLSTATYGYKAYGDAASGNGGDLDFNIWEGGKVEFCTTAGVHFKNVDQSCDHNRVTGVSFESNTGKAVHAVGPRSTLLEGCNWTGNTNNLTLEDGSPATEDNTLIGFDVVGGAMSGGTLTFSGTLESVKLKRAILENVTATLTTPGNNILVEDCQETSVTIAGTATAWIRNKTTDRGATFGITTGATATKAWAITLDRGQCVFLEAKVIARMRNGIDRAYYYIATSARRPSGTLNYESQSANFTLGEVLTGGTSGATARIVADTDSGTTGALGLQDVVGTFIDDEIVTDGSGGSATVNGLMTVNDVVLEGAVSQLRTAVETSDSSWNATFVANGPQVELQVTGASSKTVEWLSMVEVVSLG